MNKRLRELLSAMLRNGASDLHVTANYPMHYRINDELVKADDKVVPPDEAMEIVFSLLTDVHRERFEREKELDFSFAIEGTARYRANVYYQRGSVGCAIRIIPFKIPTIAECGLPEGIVKDFCKAQKGLVLVTGATGSGKSTTLAAMVDEINNTRKCHIITVEDPLEFTHVNNKAVIDQREVTVDTFSFNDALRHVLREDPDVILVGELRDLESIRQALIIADTGHLVLTTLHTSDAVQSINRIIDVFPSHQQRQIRIQLSFVLLGIIAQQLVPSADNKRLVLATELMIASPSVRSMIREEKIHQLYSAIQTSQKIGMKTMNQALAELHRAGKISYESAVSRSSDPEELAKLVGYRP